MLLIRSPPYLQTTLFRIPKPHFRHRLLGAWKKAGGKRRQRVRSKYCSLRRIIHYSDRALSLEILRADSAARQRQYLPSARNPQYDDRELLPSRLINWRIVIPAQYLLDPSPIFRSARQPGSDSQASAVTDSDAPPHIRWRRIPEAVTHLRRCRRCRALVLLSSKRPFVLRNDRAIRFDRLGIWLVSIFRFQNGLS